MFLFIPATRIRVSARWRAFIRTSWGSLLDRSGPFSVQVWSIQAVRLLSAGQHSIFNLLLLVRDLRLELLLLLCRSRLEILPFFATVTSKFSTLLADAAVDVSTVRNARPRWQIKRSRERFVRIRSPTPPKPRFSACSGRDPSLKRHYEIIWGRPFEHEETNPNHQYGSIRVAPGQKGHKGSHNS